MSVQSYPYYEQLPSELQEMIWNKVMWDFRQDHQKTHGRDLRVAPYTSAEEVYERKLTKCLDNDDENHRYRNIRDYIQSLADQRRLCIIYSENNQEVWLAVSASFNEEDLEQTPKIMVSSVWEDDTDAPLYEEDDEYIPRWEVPPNEHDKELCSVWFNIKGDLWYKFAINIDADLVIDN